MVEITLHFGTMIEIPNTTALENRVNAVSKNIKSWSHNMSFKSSKINGVIVCISVLLIVIYGVAQLVAATKWGAGLSPDSINYILSARGILENGSLKDLGSHYPPLYPMVLAICGATGSEILTVARWVQIVIYCSNIMIFGYIHFKIQTKPFYQLLLDVHFWLLPNFFWKFMQWLGPSRCF